MPEIQTKFEGVGFQIRFQSRPASEGRDGCFIEELYDVLIHRLRSCQSVLPCEQNEAQIEFILSAKRAQKHRIAEREKAGVLGTKAAVPSNFKRDKFEHLRPKQDVSFEYVKFDPTEVSAPEAEAPVESAEPGAKVVVEAVAEPKAAPKGKGGKGGKSKGK